MDEKTLNVLINIFIVGTVVTALTSTVWQWMESKSPPLQAMDNTSAPLTDLSAMQSQIQNLETLEQTFLREAAIL